MEIKYKYELEPNQEIHTHFDLMHWFIAGNRLYECNTDYYALDNGNITYFSAGTKTITSASLTSLIKDVEKSKLFLIKKAPLTWEYELDNGPLLCLCLNELNEPQRLALIVEYTMDVECAYLDVNQEAYRCAVPVSAQFCSDHLLAHRLPVTPSEPDNSIITYQPESLQKFKTHMDMINWLARGNRIREIGANYYFLFNGNLKYVHVDERTLEEAINDSRMSLEDILKGVNKGKYIPLKRVVTKEAK